jgi:hypothetical protein
MTLSDHLRNDLDMQPTTGDPAIFFKAVRGVLHGLSSTYVDNLLIAGSHSFEKETDITSCCFVSRPREFDNIRFAGTEINANTNGFTINEREYSGKMSTLLASARFSDFASFRALVA